MNAPRHSPEALRLRLQGLAETLRRDLDVGRHPGLMAISLRRLGGTADRAGLRTIAEGVLPLLKWPKADRIRVFLDDVEAELGEAGR